MVPSKKGAARNSNEADINDAEFVVKHGIDVSRRLYKAMECNICGDYLYALRPSVWACAKMRCGRLLERETFIERLKSAVPEARGIILLDFLAVVEKRCPY